MLFGAFRCLAVPCRRLERHAGRQEVEFANVREHKYCKLHITVNGDIGASFLVPARDMTE